MVNWLNYHHLQYFWAVAREGSVVKASEFLHVTPATISIQLRDLEKSLGVELFRKSGRGLALTEMGRRGSGLCGRHLFLGSRTSRYDQRSARGWADGSSGRH
jgi:hypothetical protein